MTVEDDNRTIYNICNDFQRRTREVIECYIPKFTICNLSIRALACGQCSKNVIYFDLDHIDFHKKSIQQNILNEMWKHYQIHLPYVPPIIGVK